MVSRHGADVEYLSFPGSPGGPRTGNGLSSSASHRVHGRKRRYSNGFRRGGVKEKKTQRQGFERGQQTGVIQRRAERAFPEGLSRPYIFHAPQTKQLSERD